MSKNVKGILGEQFGKVGPVVARKFREENVYSAYQKKVFNPRTEKQQIQRMRFKALSELAHGFACGAIFGFRTAAKGTNLSPRNLFQKTNWPFVTAESTDSLHLDYTGMSVSVGGLSNVFFNAPNFDIPGTVSVSFNNTGAPCQRTAGDRVFIYVYCPDAGTGILSEGVEPSVKSVKLMTPADWNGLKVHIWGFVRNQGEANLELGIPAGECSDSQYCGSGNIG